MMEAVPTYETSVYFNETTRPVSQKAVILKDVTVSTSNAVKGKP
jgi:hypothetical protein